VRSYQRDEIPLPNPVALALLAALEIIGYQVQTDPMQAGGPVTVDLYWRGGTALQSSQVTLRWLVQDERLAVWQGVVAPALVTTPAANEILCQRIRTTVPANLTAGNYRLEVATGDAFVALTTIVIQKQP